MPWPRDVPGHWRLPRRTCRRVGQQANRRKLTKKMQSGVAHTISLTSVHSDLSEKANRRDSTTILRAGEGTIRHLNIKPRRSQHVVIPITESVMRKHCSSH